MFDLFRTRQKFVRIALGAVLLIVALAMVITLIPGYGGMGAQSNDEVLASVAGDKITNRDVRQEVERRIAAKAMSSDEAMQMVPTIVNQMITDRALSYQASQMGFGLTDADVAGAIRKLIPQLFENGQFAGTEAYAAVLARQNMTIPEFEAQIRLAALEDGLMNLVADGIVITPEEIHQEFMRRNKKAKIAYAAVSQQDLASKATVTEEQMRKAYETMKRQYMKPEMRDFELFILDADQLSAGIQVSDQDLRFVYGQERERFQTPERVKVRHILLMTTGKSPAEKAKLHQKAEDLLKQLKAGADFATLAKANSDDPGSAARGGEMDWIVRGQTVPNFERVAFSLPPHQLSGVIETEYGYHILEVLDHQKSQMKPFDEVKDQLRAEVRKQRVYDRMQTLADQLRSTAVRSIPEAEAMARKENINIVEAKDIRRGLPIPDIKTDPELVGTLYSLPLNGLSQVMTVGENKLAIARVTKITPPQQATFEEVKERVRKSLEAQIARTEFQKLLARIPSIMAADGNDLDKIAKQLGAKITTTSEFTADGAIDGFGPANMMPGVFQKPVGTVVGPYPLAGQVAVAKILQVTDPDPAKLADEKTQIYNDLQQRQLSMRRELFAEGVMKELTDSRKVKLNQTAIMDLARSYQGQ